jgi:hypothetical protein
MTDAQAIEDRAYGFALTTIAKALGLSVDGVPMTKDIQDHVDGLVSAREHAVRKEYEWILIEIVGWGMQTELSDLDLTTAEFSEIWREAQKLLKQAKAVKP